MKIELLQQAAWEGTAKLALNFIVQLLAWILKNIYFFYGKFLYIIAQETHLQSVKLYKPGISRHLIKLINQSCVNVKLTGLSKLLSMQTEPIPNYVLNLRETKLHYQTNR